MPDDHGSDGGEALAVSVLVHESVVPPAALSGPIGTCAADGIRVCAVDALGCLWRRDLVLVPGRPCGGK